MYTHLGVDSVVKIFDTKINLRREEKFRLFITRFDRLTSIITVSTPESKLWLRIDPADAVGLEGSTKKISSLIN